MEHYSECATKMVSQYLPTPSTKDIIRYRYEHGINVGGFFNLEQWLYPSMHDKDVSSPSEIDAVVSSVPPPPIVVYYQLN